MHRRLVEAEVPVLHGPRAEPWGVTARYTDPDGNVVELVEPKRSREPTPFVVVAIPKQVRLATERKTGLYVGNVETTGLIKDERGWLQLVG
jgi:hypothetical protein